VCTPVTPAVSYLPTELVGCLVNPGISCSARKLTRTPRVKRKKRYRWITSVVTCQIVSYRRRNARIHDRRLIRGMEIRNRSEDAYHLLLSCRTQTQAARRASGLAGWLRHVKFTCNNKAMDWNEEGDFISQRNCKQTLTRRVGSILLKSRVNRVKLIKLVNSINTQSDFINLLNL
jgi:hypothetical protein